MPTIAARLTAALILLVAACGGATPSGEVSRPRDGDGFALAEHDGRPRVVSLERKGDPAAGVALFIERSTRDADAHAALAALLADRLAAVGLGLEVRADATGILISSFAQPSSGRAWVDAVDGALRRPVAPNELAGVTTRLAGEVRARDAGRAAADGCRGELAHGNAAPTVVALERARSLAFSPERATIGVVGTNEMVRVVDDRVASLSKWPSSTAEPVAAADVPPLAVVRSADLGGRQERVSVARYVPDATSAVAVARALRDDPRSFVARLRAVADRASLSALTGVALARGGCVGIEVTYDVDESAPPARREVAALVLAEAERPVAPDAGLAFAIPSAVTDARDAALVAARWHTPRVAGVARQHVLVELPPMASDADLARARESLERLTTSAAAPSRFVTRDEAGQGALWVAIGPQCAPQRSSLRGHGEAALGVLALVGEGTRDDGVEIEVLRDFGGLVAHAEPRKGESPAALASRVAGALGRAYYADVPPADVVLVARGIASRWLESSWGRDATAVEDFAEILSPTSPENVEPLGSPELVRTFDVSLAGRATRALMRRPVTIAALLDEPGSDEGTTVRAVLDAHGRGLPRDACPPAATARAPGRRVDAPTRLKGDVAVARLGLVGSLDEAFALGVLGELLAQSVPRSAGGPSFVVRSRLTGAPVVHVEIRAREEVLATTIQAFDALLTRLARGEVTDQSLRAAIARVALAATIDEADPRARLARLMAGRPVEVPAADPAAVRAWLARRVAPASWSGVVVHAE